MAISDRFRNALVRVARPMLEKAGYGMVPGSGLSSWLYGAGTGLPHEPFAGAWQRNLDSAKSAGPNILAFTAVYACINIISSDIARMPVRVLRQKPERKGREEFRNHPAWRVMRRPNDFQTSLQFIQQYMTSKLITGNTYVFLARDNRGVINAMYVLDPREVTALITEDGSIYYRLNMNPLAGLPDGITVPASEIIHDRMSTMWHPLVGVSPLFSAGVSAMAGARMLGSTESFFANMSRASGVLTSPGKIEKALAQRMQDEWEKNYSKGGIGKTAVLSNGLKFEPMTINAVDSAIVDQLRWTVEDVARAYRVPGFKLGDLTKVSYRNSEQMARDYYQGCLSYHIESYEECMNRAFGLPDDIEIEFDLSGLFRMETDTRYAAHKTALTAGFKSINEVRYEEDLPPVEGGDEPRVQAQYIPLSLANGEGVNIPGATPAPAPPAPEPTPDATSGKGLSEDDMEDIVGMFMERIKSGDYNA